MKSRKKLIFICISFIVLAFVSCSTKRNLIKTNEPISRTIPFVNDTPPYNDSKTKTINPTILSTNAILPKTPFLQITRTGFNEPELLSTWTPFPTKSTSESELLITDLLLHNDNCELPCWWGMTPKVTTWSEAKQFLDSFTLVEGPINYEESGTQKIGYQIKYSQNNKEMSFGVSIEQGMISDFGIPSDISINNYKVNQLLSRLQQPTEIWLAPIPATPGGPWFYLVINYPERGILARYGGSAKPIIGTNGTGQAIISGLHICPMGIGPELWLSSANQVSNVMENPALGGREFTDLLIPIQNATEMTVDSFFQTFREADNNSCFNTYRQSWK